MSLTVSELAAVVAELQPLVGARVGSVRVEENTIVMAASTAHPCRVSFTSMPNV